MEAYHVLKLHPAVLWCSEESEVVCCITSVCTKEQTVHVCAKVCQRSENLQTDALKSTSHVLSP